MPTVLLLLATVAALLGVAFWWIRRNNLAVYPAGRGPLVRQPLPTGCDLGERLMAASAVDAPQSAPAAGSGVAAPERAAAPAPAKPPKRKKPSGPSRRAFLRNSWLIAWLGVLASFGGASLAFLWPNLRGGFGAVIDLDSEDAVAAAIAEGGGRFEYPSGRMYIVSYDPANDPDGDYADITNGAPFMALYQRCVHLGCRVPWCASSSWFECPCHGSRYNRWGEYQFGPAPRGLDRFNLSVEEGRVTVDTSTVITGPSRQTSILGEPPSGPHCN
ncbi:MAG: Rieske 2Fe-2S domain-containing protein [Euzebyaceae bacterium]|nr:Rieske 2Fe-2S domain-containing protein [Euzebyaceae bacterium]